MPVTKDDIPQSLVDGEMTTLPEAERQAIADERNAPAIPVDDIPLTVEERLQLLEAENPVPLGKIRIMRQAKRDRGEA